MSCQLPRAAIAASLIAISACAVEPADREPPPFDVVYNGVTCGNGIFDGTELCVENPGKTVIAAGEQVVTVLSRDVDNDAINDVVAVSQHRIWVRKGTPGGFGAQTSFGFVGASFTDIAIGDFDGDGLPDLAATDGTGNRVAVLHNNGGLVFAAWALINVAANPVRILAGRINSDIRSDLVVLSFGTQQAQVLLANGAPFAGPVAYMVGDAEDLALADCNLDGRPDLLYATGVGNAARLRARAADMFGNLGAPISSVLPLVDATFGPLDAFAIAAGDLDGDADADAVVSASFARLAPMVNVGGCNFAPAFNAATMPVTWAWTRARLRTVDWNGDAHLDVAAPHGDPGSPGDQVYSIVPGTGVGTFLPYLAEPHPPGTVVPKDLAFVDVNGDGRLDVLVAAATGVVLETRIQ
jgi:hypothetical protein